MSQAGIEASNGSNGAWDVCASHRWILCTRLLLLSLRMRMSTKYPALPMLLCLHYQQWTCTNLPMEIHDSMVIASHHKPSGTAAGDCLSEKADTIRHVVVALVKRHTIRQVVVALVKYHHTLKLDNALLHLVLT
jgi:hypothetical protein